MELLEIGMELVILSTVAAVAILLAELRDLAGRERVDRSSTVTGTARIASVADLATGSDAANQERPAPPAELDRAA
jgi:hypothetical protein